jgi:hypothetical protein
VNCPTKRAADWWDSSRLTDIFLASGFFCSQAESTPAHQRLTQTVGRFAKWLHKNLIQGTWLMKNHLKLFVIVIVCILPLIACGSQSLPIPTPTFTPKPSVAPAPTNTLTPLPTFTPTAQRILSTERHHVYTQQAQRYLGGYSFLVPIHLVTTLSDVRTTFQNDDGTIWISFTTESRKDNTQTIETVLNDFLANIKINFQELDASVPYSEKISDRDGLAVNVKGTRFDVKNSGKLIVVDTGQGEFFIAFALVVDGNNLKRWDSEGGQVFDALINSVQFFHD